MHEVIKLFDFYKYINPSWYFALKPNKKEQTYFLNWEYLQNCDNSNVVFDENYSSFQVSELDAAYQAWKNGIIYVGKSNEINFDNLNLTISDNYRFVKKYFSSFWIWYIFFLRIFIFKSSLNEVAVFFKSIRIKKIKNNLNNKSEVTLEEHCSNHVLKEYPKISVIIPTLNRYELLRDTLHDLEKQSYKNFNVIIVDQSDNYELRFYEKFDLEIIVIRQKEKALWKARNTAIKNTNSKYILLFDDDSRVEGSWIYEHIKCLNYFEVDISSGVSISKVGGKISDRYQYFCWSDQIDTGNVMIRRDVFEKVGLFDRQFEKQRKGDGEFGMRCFLEGFKNISNPLAKRLHLKTNVGGLRDMGHWDGFRPKKILDPRPIPSVLYYTRKYFGNENAFLLLLINIPPSIMPYKLKKFPIIIFLFGLVTMFFFLPIVFYQIVCSWKISSRMLIEGSKIDKLV